MSSQAKGLKELLKDSYLLFRGNVLRLFGIAVTGTGFSMVAVIITMILTSLTAAFSGVKTQEPGIVAAVYGGIFVFISFLILMTVYLLSSIAMIRVIDTANRGKAAGIFEAFKFARLQSLPYSAAMTLSIVKIVLWSLLFIIPGIIFGIFYSLYAFAVVVDGKRGNQALIFSAKIIKPQIWRCVGYYVVMSLVSLLLFLAVESITGLVFGEPQKGQFLPVPALGLLVAFVLNAAIGFYYFAFTYLFYEDLKKSSPVQPL